MAPPPPVIKDPTLLDSDPEDDDFALSDGDSSSSDSEAESRPSKRLKGATPPPTVMSKGEVDDLWASFNSVEPTVDPVMKGIKGDIKEGRRKVKIMVKYQFVGEEVQQEKEVWSDSKEAIDYFASRTSLPSTVIDIKGKGKSSDAATSKMDALFGEAEEVPEMIPKVEVPKVEETAVKRPPPMRRKGGGLAALAAAGKPAKLNTLEKSKLDWNKFVDKEDLGEDLSKARKDGYLDKQDFLQRTEDRKEADYEAVKSARAGRKP